MSVAWFVVFVLLWTGFLAGFASLITNGRVSARFAQTVWRGAAVLSVLPLAIIPLLKLLPKDLPSAIPDLPYVEPAAGAVASASVNLQSAVSAPDWAWTAPALLGVLIVGWAFRLGASALGQVRLQQLKSRSMPHREQSIALPLSNLRLERAPLIRLIDGGSPFIAGLAERSVYVPEALNNPSDLRQIVIHECVHLQRGDLVTRPLERLVADLFWFSPFAWMMRRELDFWREAVCDEIASEVSGDRFGYARTLAYAARISAPARTLPVAAFILPKKRSLPKRLSRLLETRPTRSRPIMAMSASVVALALSPFALAEAGKDVMPARDDRASQSIVFEHAVLESEKAKITSKFGNRKDPFSKKERWHKGTDIGAPEGTPVYTPSCGTVVFSGYKPNYGETVEIAFDDGSKMRFAQLSDRDVEVGEEISVGTKIGAVGMSGRATGPHLHLEHWKKAINEETGETEYQPHDPMMAEGLVLFAGGSR
ncbi:M23/M56 family metallopeptidase [Henriciella sp. AS95]|uniref:M23/M56 family metallopeptidase n=1 Tax=Henriciella sp. AS95 TaxID=3135782 RepID=UPI003170943F